MIDFDTLDANSEIECPFCGETGFDRVGLKGHLEHDCEKYMESETTVRLFNH